MLRVQRFSVAMRATLSIAAKLLEIGEGLAPVFGCTWHLGAGSAKVFWSVCHILAIK
jgi:hypothetical protein